MLPCHRTGARRAQPMFQILEMSWRKIDQSRSRVVFVIDSQVSCSMLFTFFFAFVRLALRSV